MKVWKDKEGKWITIKEFFSRFKQGVNNITPLQKITNERNSAFVTLAGFIVALIAVIITREKIGLLSYGLILIFVGSIWSSGIKFISLVQQLKYLKDPDSGLMELNTMLNEEKKEVENV